MHDEALTAPSLNPWEKNSIAILLSGSLLILAFLASLYIGIYFAIIVGLIAIAAPFWNMERGLLLFLVVTLLWPHMLAWSLGAWIWDPSRIVLILMLLTWMVALMQGQVRLRKTPLDLAFLLLAAMMLLSIVINNPGMNSEQSSRAIKTFANFFVEWGLLYYLVTSIVKDWLQARKIVSIIAALLTIVALVGIFEYITGFRFFEWLRHYLPGGENMIADVHEGELNVRAEGYLRGDVLRIVSTTMSYQEVGTLMATAIPLLMYLIAYARKRSQTIIWAVSLTIVISALFLSVTRGAIIAAVVAIFCTSLFSIRRLLRTAFVPLIALSIVAILLFPSVPGAILSVTEPSELSHESSFQGRFKDWPEAGKLLQEHELLGVGLGQVTQKLLDYGRVVSIDFRVVDNWYLALATETGLLGIGAIFILWGAIFAFLLKGYRMRRTLAHGVWDLRVAILSSGIAYMIMCFTFDAGAFVTIAKMFFILIALGVVISRTAEVPFNNSSSSKLLDPFYPADSTLKCNG